MRSRSREEYLALRQAISALLSLRSDSPIFMRHARLREVARGRADHSAGLEMS